MKSSEFITEEIVDEIDDGVDSDMRDTEKRRARLRKEIAAGYAPVVHNVSSTVDPVYTMGDVEALGWMTKDYSSTRSGAGDDDYDVSWTRFYHRDAPGPIRVKSGSGEPTVWQPGYVEEL